MPYKKIYRRKKGRKTPRYKRRVRVGRTVGKLNDNTTYRYTRTCILGTITSSTTADQLGAYSFTLNLLPDVSEFLNLYDSYTITGVKLSFIPRFTSNTTTTVNPGVFMYVMDYDDANPLTTTVQMLEHQSIKYRSPVSMKPMTIFVRPKAALAAYSGAFTSYAQTTKSQWIDCGSPNVQFYGVKWAWTVASVTFSLDVYAKYYLKFKSVR